MEFDYDAAVEVRFAEDLTYAEVAPLLDALAATQIFSVRASRVGWSGPAAGGPELGIVLTAVAATGAVVFAKSFCEELGKDSYRAVRAAILAVVRRLRERDPEEVRAMVPLAIYVGNVKICIGGSLHEPRRSGEEWSDEWLVARLERAQAIVDAEFGRERKRDDEPIGPDDPCPHWLDVEP